MPLMDLRNLTYPSGYPEIAKPEEDPRVERFERLVWYNGEVCNNCFQQIRAIGEKIEKATTLFVHRYNEYYERTEHGSQEHDPFALAADRYGQCYCLDCGADTKAENGDLSLEAMRNRAVNLSRYINTHTDYWLDGEAYGRALREFKAVPENQGYDSEIFAVGTVYAVETERPSESPTSAAPAD